jgi:hypothetical protein
MMSPRNRRHPLETSPPRATLLGATVAMASTLLLAGAVTIITSKAWPLDQEIAASTTKRTSVIKVVLNQRLKGNRLDREDGIAARMVDDQSERDGLSGGSIVPKSIPPLPSYAPGPEPEVVDDDCEVFTIEAGLEEGSSRSLQFRCTASLGRRATVASISPRDAPCAVS